MKIYIFKPEPMLVDSIPPQLGPEVPVAAVGRGKALVVEGEWRFVRTPNEAGKIKLVWGWYYDASRRQIFLNVNDAPDALLAYLLAKAGDGPAPMWAHDWQSGRMNVFFCPSEIGDPDRTRAKFARVAENRRRMLEELRQEPSKVMQMLTNRN